MIEVYSNLYVGDIADYEGLVSRLPGWAVVHACKDPYHREALGYKGRGAPKNDPEYLLAYRGHRLMLNMIDADDPKFFSQEMIASALAFIEKHHSTGWKVLVQCNKGESRAPSLALLYLATQIHILPCVTLEMAEEYFRQLYPNYHPKAGIRGHLQQYWEQYRGKQTDADNGDQG